MQRYDLTYRSWDGAVLAAEPHAEPEGDWVYFEDAEAAVAAERERCRKVIEDELAAWRLTGTPWTIDGERHLRAIAKAIEPGE